MIQDCFRATLLQQAKLGVVCKNKALVNTASHTLEHFMNQETAWNSTKRDSLAVYANQLLFKFWKQN